MKRKEEEIVGGRRGWAEFKETWSRVEPSTISHGRRQGISATTRRDLRWNLYDDMTGPAADSLCDDATEPVEDGISVKVSTRGSAVVKG